MTRVIAALTALSVLSLAMSSARAIERQWNVGSGAWGISTNWNPVGVPGSTDVAYVDHFSGGPGTATVATNVGSPVSVQVQSDNTVRIDTQGVLGTQGDVVVGRNNSGGVLNVTNPNPAQAYFGRLNVGGSLRVGLFSGFGTVNQNAGAVTVTGEARVGDSREPGSVFRGVGTYNLSGSGALTAARLEVAPDTFTDGTFNLSGGTATFAAMRIGYSGNGVFNQTGGQLNMPGAAVVMGRFPGTAVYNFSGGTFNAVGMTFSFDSTATLNYRAGNLSIGQLSMANGRVLLTSGGNKVLRATLLGMYQSKSELIDLNDNAMVVGFVLAESMRSMISRGFNNGSWNGNGITSSAAADVAASGGPRTGLGFGHAFELGFSTYGGQPVDPFDTIVQYTLIGDANLDGVVSLSDFNRLAANFGAAEKTWPQGDFNYDGLVSLHDFNLLAANFGLSAAGPEVTPHDWAALAAAVPEPAALAGAAGLAAAALLRLDMARRPRRRSSSTYEGDATIEGAW